MPDYKKMYTVLCAAIDCALDELSVIPEAAAPCDKLQRALWDAEELFIEADIE